MVVEVLAARNIEATDLLGTSDPYAVVSLGRTAVQNSGEAKDVETGVGRAVQYNRRER